MSTADRRVRPSGWLRRTPGYRRVLGDQNWLPARLALVLASCCLALIVLPAEAWAGFSLQSSFGTGQLENPIGVAVDQANGKVFVGNLLGDQNQAFTSGGQLLAPPSPFPSEGNYSGVAVNPTNNDVFVVNAVTHSIETYDPETGTKLPGGEFEVPNSGNFFGFFTAVQIASDFTGNVYVPVGPENEVRVFSPSGGTPVGVSPVIRGTGSHVLSDPSGVAVTAAGDIWVADAGDGRLEEFDSTGAFLAEISSPGVAAVAVDEAGHVFASASGGQIAVTEYTYAGVEVQKIGTGILSPSANETVPGLDYDISTEDLYVADAGNNLIRVFAPAPAIAPLSATNITETSATLSGTVDPEGRGIAGCRFDYGLEAGSYEHTTPCAESTTEIESGTPPVEVHAAVSGLSASSNYHFRLTAEDVKGNVAHGPDQTVATQGAPSIESEKAEPRTHTAEISAMIDPFQLSTGCSVEYVSQERFTESGYASARSAACEPPQIVAGEVPVAVHASLSGLAVGTTYHYRLLASNGAGTTTGTDNSLATFGIDAFGVETLDREGHPYTQAGGHPYSLVTGISFVTAPDFRGALNGSEASPKDIKVALPPGLIGNPVAMPRCVPYDLNASLCSGESQVGMLKVVIGRESEAGERAYELPIYDLIPPRGMAAEFGSKINGLGLAYIDAGIDTGGDYGIDSDSLNISADEPVIGVEVTLWGDPADPSHDSERFCPATQEQVNGGERVNEIPPCSSEAPRRPFLREPSSCSGPLSVSVRADAWEAPGEFVSATTQMPAATGCDQVAFGPSLTVNPTTVAADSPSGLDVDVHVPQAEHEEVHGTAQSDLRDATVTLPEGLTVDPSSANGLGACSAAQIELHGPEPAACPDASKLGTVEIDSPLVSHPLDGYVYLARPFENPFRSLLALYIGVADPETGVVIKLAGEVAIDPRTGRLTSSFLQNPQLPFEDLKLDFFEGPRAPLRTPSTCGSFEVTSQLTPWSAPESGPPATPSSKFAVTQAAGGGHCPTSAGEEPNAPSFEAGTVNPTAAAYSPFVLHLARADGSQEIGKIETTLPEGLLAKIAGVSECSDADIAKAESRNKPNEGATEQADPSCPSSSEVGTVKVGAGAGPQPFYATGHAYLAGPYEGAPLSLVVITPAVAGPFDLGDVVVRAALHVDPLSAQVTAVSDPIPHILQGIPLDVRSISLELNRPQFTVNPTNCGPKEISGTATSLLGGAAPLKSAFEAANCASLTFRPQLKLGFSGQTRRTGNPAIKAVLTQPEGQNSNIAGATVILPKGMLIDQAHINDPCTRVQFSSGAVPGEGCPAGSVLGSAKVWTPLLEAPEEGKVYFRSNGGERQLPDLVVALQGKIPVELVGFIDSVGRKGAEVRRVRTRFQSVPDAPVSRFELKLAGGRRGLIENSANLCTAGDRAGYLLTGQNGKAYDTEPKVAVTCHAKKKASGAKHRGGGAKPGH